MHRFHPFAGIVVASAAIAIAGSALAAATAVNIADPTKPARIAHVDAGGKLAVEQAAPADFYHAATFATDNTTGCVVIATPPVGKALIVRQVRVNVFSDPAPGADNNVAIYADSTCTSEVGDVNPATVGQTTISFDPGLAIPAGSAVSASIPPHASVRAEEYVDGYTIVSTAVPGANVWGDARGRSRQR
jgi:hypothetical protein